MLSGMKLRFWADIRTLIWAGLLLPLGPGLAFWRPALLPWLVPLLLYGSYSSGVLSHNHNHCPVFVGRRSNLLYGAWLSFFYGFPAFAWIPSHNQDHHLHLNTAQDASYTQRGGRADSLFTLLSYPIVCSLHQLPLVLRFAGKHLRKGSPQATRIVLETAALVAGHAAVLALALWLHGAQTGALIYTVAVGVPALLGNYWMMLTNYLQHVGCEPATVHDHSRNFVSPLWNWFVFDNGFHTVHHQQPGLHWSRGRARHQLAQGRIRPELNRSFILSYAAQRYLRRRAQRSTTADS
jgi:beta-carotene hydroxylase